MSDILVRLRDLLKQATEERSHYYVASCCRDAIDEIARLTEALKKSEVLLLRVPKVIQVSPEWHDDVRAFFNSGVQRG